jgi:hypothetical protein
MDDFALLKEMADRTPLPSATDLSPARARLTAAFTQPTNKDEQMTATEPTRLPPGKPRRRRRLVVSGIAVVGLAAAITGVVALGGLEQVGVAPPKANAAAEVLHQAADAARAQPFTPPRPDQFLYTKVQGSDGSVAEFWHSVDGTHDGLISRLGETFPTPGCKDGQAAGYNEYGEPAAPSPCVPLPAYLSDVPTDPAKMQAYLEGLGGAPGINSLGKNILYLAQDHYVSPEALAALFESLASIPGLTVDENVTDGAGRPGIGVSWKSDGVDENGKRAKLTSTLVFDPTTHAFLGWAGVSALVEKEIVDTAGQRP